jgi:hypothetical protein
MEIGLALLTSSSPYRSDQVSFVEKNMNDDTYLENLWNDLLSRDAIKAQAAFSRLEIEEQQDVLLHLKRMTTDQGWHPEQRASAAAALEALASFE